MFSPNPKSHKIFEKSKMKEKFLPLLIYNFFVVENVCMHVCMYTNVRTHTYVFGLQNTQSRLMQAAQHRTIPIGWDDPRNEAHVREYIMEAFSQVLKRYINFGTTRNNNVTPGKRCNPYTSNNRVF